MRCRKSTYFCADISFTYADRPPPPPPGAPPPRDSGPMPQDQWLRAIKTIDGVQYPYWYNPARLDAQGRPICSWTCPALADEPATNSAGQSHRSASSGRELEPNLSNIAVTEVPVANCVNAGKALTLASTELERVFYEVFPGSGEGGTAPSIITLMMLAHALATQKFFE